MIRARTRARTGGQPPLIPSWTVTPENLPPGYVYTGGLRTQVNQDGSIGWAPHNAIRRSQFQAIVGSPGSLGDGWGPLGTVNGITRECVGVGTIDGHNYVDVRYYGTSTAAFAHAIQPNTSVAFGFGAVAGDTVSGAVFVQLIAGSLPTARRFVLQITERTSAGAFVTNSSLAVDDVGVVLGGPAIRVALSRTLTGSTTAYFDPALRLDATATPVSVDFTVRVYGFQANLGPVSAATFPSTGSGAYLPRTADYSDSMEPVLGPELVLDPSIDNSSAWVLTQPASGAVSVAGGQINLSTLDGSYAAASLQGSQLAALPLAGRRYRVSITLAAVSGGGVRVDFAGITGVARTSPGTYVVDVTATQSWTLNVVRGATSACSGTVTAVSAREITGYVGSRRGIKLEAQATNLLRNSQAMGSVPGQLGSGGSLPTNWYSDGHGSVAVTVLDTGSAGVAQYIDIRYQGTTNTSGCNLMFEQNTGVAASQGQTYCASGWTQLIAGAMSGVNTIVAVFERNSDGSYLVAGTRQIAVAPNPTAYELSRTLAQSTAAFVQQGIRFEWASGAAIDFTVRVWAQQLEGGTVATSYTPTYGSQVTRAADVLYWPTSAITSWSAGSNRTVVVEANTKYNTFNGVLDRVFEIYSEASAHFEYLARQGANTATFGFSTQGWNAAGYFGDGLIKLAVATNDTNSRMRSSQGPAMQTVVGGGRTDLSRLYLGNRIAADRGVRGSIYRLDYYPRAANDSQLQALTA